MRASIHERVERFNGVQSEVTDIVLTTTDPVEQERLGMLKARARVLGVMIVGHSTGSVVLRVVRPLQPALPHTQTRRS